MGFVGTAVGRTAIARLGLLHAGMLATSLQASLLLGAWAVHRFVPRNPIMDQGLKVCLFVFAELSFPMVALP